MTADRVCESSLIARLAETAHPHAWLRASLPLIALAWLRSTERDGEGGGTLVMRLDRERSLRAAPSGGRTSRRGMRWSSRATQAGALAFIAIAAVMLRTPSAGDEPHASVAPTAVVDAGEVAVPRDTAAGAANASSNGPTQVAMRNVDFHADSSIVLRIHHLRGTMRGREGRPIVFDDKRSFLFRLTFAQVSILAEDLAELLNRHVFAFEGAPLRRLSIRMEGQELVQSGQMKKGFWIPFRVRAQVAAMPDGRIRLHPTRVRVLGIPAEAVMRWFGIHLDDMISLGKARGVAIDGNDLLLDPAALLPDPAIEGRVTSVRIDGDRLVQVFGTAGAAESLGVLRVPVSRDGNYMFYRGGTLRFGKLVMNDADLEIVDMDPRDPFRFFLDRYNEQLVAGYSRTLPDLGLAAYMKDLDDLPSPVSSPRDTGQAR